MFILLLLVLGLSVPVVVQSQVACFDYGDTLSCDGPSGNTSITEFSRGQGIITQQGRNGSSMEPYTIIGQDRERRSSYSRQPIEPLERLPSYGGSSTYGSSSFEKREAAREHRLSGY